jgi:hypothetical protein
MAAKRAAAAVKRGANDEGAEEFRPALPPAAVGEPAEPGGHHPDYLLPPHAAPDPASSASASPALASLALPQSALPRLEHRPRRRAPGAHDGRPRPGRSFRSSSSLGWLRRHASCNSARRRSAASRAFLLALLSRSRSAQRSVTGPPVAGDPPAPARRPRPSAARPPPVGLRPKKHPPVTASRLFDIFPRKAPKHDGPSARPPRLRTARFRSRKASRLRRLRRLPRFRWPRFHHAAGRRGAVRLDDPLVEGLRTG